MKNLNEVNLVTQANNLVEARYNLTKSEQLIICTMISFINPDDEDFLTYKVSISDFANLLGLQKRTVYKDIDDITTKLLSRVIKIETETGWEKYQWVSYAKADKTEDELLLRFHDNLKPYLLALKKRFTSFRLKEVISLKSVYAIRMYQLLVDYSNRGESIFTYSLADFRDMMLGEKSKKYQVFKNFRVRVLDAAKQELDEKSNLSFEFKTKRINRKIAKIEFQIIQISRDVVVDNTERFELIEKFELLGIKQDVLMPYLERDGQEALERTLQIYKRDKKAGRIRENEQGYLIGLLKAKAGVMTEAEQRQEEAKRKAEQERIEKERQEKLEEQKNLLVKEFLKQKKEAYLASLSAEDEDKILDKVKEKYRENSFILKMIKDIKSPIVQDDINKIIKSFDGYAEEEQAYIQKNLK